MDGVELASTPSMARPPIAMVSRIRVEVRGETMEGCEAVAFQAIEHARQAGILEGYMPTRGEWTDHFFQQPQVTRKFGEPANPWDELGLTYTGRIAFTCDPMASYGGLQQYGYEVARVDDGDREYPLPPVAEHGFIVLERQRPVAREHTWEVSPLGDSLDETGESILDDIRTIKGVLTAEARINSGGASVRVYMHGEDEGTVFKEGEDLREAAAKARDSVLVRAERATGPIEFDEEQSSAASAKVVGGPPAHEDVPSDRMPRSG